MYEIRGKGPNFFHPGNIYCILDLRHEETFQSARILDLRHEETFQSARSRQHRSRIVDKQIVFFFANRVDGVVVGSQIEPAGAPRSAQSSQIEPARAAGAARSSQTRPNRASKGARGSQSEPIEARSSQQGRPGRARGAQAAPAGRPAERAGASLLSWPARRAISIWIFMSVRSKTVQNIASTRP